jgi:hypothetical protein
MGEIKKAIFGYGGHHFFGLNSGVIRDINQSGVFVGTPARKTNDKSPNK